MSYTDDPGDLIDRHTQLSNELAQQIRDLGETRSALATHQHNVWRQFADGSVTERREEVRHASAHLVAESETQVAEIDALRVELANVDLRVRYLTGS